MDALSQRRQDARFLGNVGVNVLANLIAALIIYLLGTALGVFPRSMEAVMLALVVFLLVIFRLLVGVVERSREDYYHKLSEAGAYVTLGLAFLVGAMMQFLGMMRLTPSEPFPWWIVGSIGLSMYLWGAWKIYRVCKDMRIDQAGEGHITGLHWFEWRLEEPAEGR